MRGLNKVQIIGNLGRDPEMKYSKDGKAIITFSVAVDRPTKATEGSEAASNTEWFRIVAWEKLAETMNEYLHKGSRVYIEGRLQSREWEDKEGVKRTTVEVVASEMLMLDPKSENGGSTPASSPNQSRQRVGTPAAVEEEVPF